MGIKDRSCYLGFTSVGIEKRKENGIYSLGLRAADIYGSLNPKPLNPKEVEMKALGRRDPRVSDLGLGLGVWEFRI